MSTKTKVKVLTYDIETVLMQFYGFSTGKQYIGHKQLVPGKSQHGIICISYCWNDGPVELLKWEPIGRQAKLIEDLDSLIKQADNVIGKNSNRFDNKMVNGIRALSGQPGMPEWVRYTDDLEVQMRRYFRLPSQSLDYISGQLGLGGKISMEFSDWVAIDNLMTVQMLQSDGIVDSQLDIYCRHMYRMTLAQVMKVGEKALNKMHKYSVKDTRDTRTLWNKLSSHFEPKFNMATFNDERLACRQCGSTNVIGNGTKISGGTKYRQYNCNNCGRYAGRTPISKVLQKEGKIK